MSHEARTIRPFLGLDEVSRVFDNSSLYFGMDHCPARGSISLVIDPEEYARRPVILEWAPEDDFDHFVKRLRDVPDDTGIPTEALSLLITASTTYLKKTEVVMLQDLIDLSPLQPKQSLVDGHRPAPFLTGHHGSSVDVYLVVNRDLEPAPLRPWRKGTWLAHAKFSLLTSIGRSMFRPTPLTKEVREELGLDGRTLRYFDIGDHDVLEPYDSQPEPPRFYVDEQLLAELSANAHSPTSKSLQLQLVLDFMTAVINESARRREDLETLSYDDIEESLLGRVLRVAVGPGARPTDRQALLSRVRNEPAKAVARAEHTVDLQKALIGAFHREES